MTVTYIMTNVEVKTYAPEINQSIQKVLVDSAILFTQDSLIKDSIGQEWYDQILSQLSGGTGYTTTENQYIIDNYLKHILAYGVWQYLAITLSLQLNDSGLRIKTSDHSQAAESKDIAFIRDFIQNYIDSRRKEMKRYIDNNKTLYPLYYSNIYGDRPSNNVYNFKIGGVPRKNKNGYNDIYTIY